jgi:hypothetical protein
LNNITTAIPPAAILVYFYPVILWTLYERTFLRSEVQKTFLFFVNFNQIKETFGMQHSIYLKAWLNIKLFHDC